MSFNADPSHRWCSQFAGRSAATPDDRPTCPRRIGDISQGQRGPRWPAAVTTNVGRPREVVQERDQLGDRLPRSLGPAGPPIRAMRTREDRRLGPRGQTHGLYAIEMGSRRKVKSMFTVRNLGGIALSLFGATLLWQTAAFASPNEFINDALWARRTSQSNLLSTLHAQVASFDHRSSRHGPTIRNQ